MVTGGIDTSSNIIAMTIYMLAKKPEIKEKLLKELKDDIKNHSRDNYDKLN